MTAAMMLLWSLTAQAPATTVPDNPDVPCAAGDLACQRDAYQRLKRARPPSADCGPTPAETDGTVLKSDAPRKVRPPCTTPPPPPPAEPLTQEKPESLPWYAIAPAQWCTVLGLDVLPALLFAVLAVVVVLPASTIPSIMLGCVACACIPGIPCVEGVATNLVGDLMARGTRRGRLLWQVGAAVGLLGVQLAAAAVGLVITGAIVNVLAVRQVAPEARYLASECGGGFTSERCVAQLQRVSAKSVTPTLVGAGGVLGIVALNLLLAVVLKGPLLALAWQAHAVEPPADSAGFLPQLANNTSNNGPVAPVQNAAVTVVNPATPD